MSVICMLHFPRQVGLKRTFCYNMQDFVEYVRRLNGKTSIYTSLFSLMKQAIMILPSWIEHGGISI